MHGRFIRRLPLETQWWSFRLLHPKIAKKFRKRRQLLDVDYSYRPFDERKAIFIHIPKCAGVAVSQALFGNMAGGHKTLSHYRHVFEPRILLDYFKFTIVRNPWDRLVSAYSFLRAGGMDDADRNWYAAELSHLPDFEAFVTQWLSRESVWRGVHFYPQSYFVESEDPRVALDFIGRFENLADDFAYIAERLGVEATLALRNDSQRGNYEDYFTPKTRDIVASVYAEDIRRFGYEF
ncbi:sulfotransferase family 2 domain-containing protein [Salinisphaera sp. T31B1]|uniref:sulfotransferase family 2 domain-containing protein n=1 Tax=Salinisphaera sp. T31B1 TaxID=727963 RepID=UPI00333F8553